MSFYPRDKIYHVISVSSPVVANIIIIGGLHKRYLTGHPREILLNLNHSKTTQCIFQLSKPVRQRSSKT